MTCIRLTGPVLAVSLLSLAAPSSNAQNQLDGSPCLFAVMAALEATGNLHGSRSGPMAPLHEQLDKYLAAKNIAVLPELKQFFAAHRKDDPQSEISQYVSFGLTLEAPPDFNYRFKATELPPDVQALGGLEELLKRFYQEADLAGLWQRLQPAYERAIADYQLPVTEAVQQVNAYLRNPTSGYLGRRFEIYVDLLGAPNQVQSRSYKDDYYVVVTPSTDPPIDEIRHGYFHYLLDPLSFKYASAIHTKRGLIDFAQAAPALENYYKDDISLLMTESLIKAIEARLTRGGPARQQAVADSALAEGYVITPALAELLPAYEKQERSMRLYYPDLINAIDLKKEERRLANIQFAQERSRKTIRVTPAEKPVELTGAYKVFEDAQTLYQQRKLAEARDAYMRVLNESVDKILHAKAYYGLARIAALERNPELSEQLFRKVLESGPDPDTKTWSFVYLGRLADAQGQRDQATENYNAALKVEGATEEARRAAEKGLKESFKGK